MKTAYELDDADIRAIALDCGFKLKPQPDGLEDLNPYVYKFARELLSTIPRPEDVAAMLAAAPTPPAKSSEDAVRELMEQAQVFASAWSLIGGVFDSGNALPEAQEAKAELEEMLRQRLIPPALEKS